MKLLAVTCLKENLINIVNICKTAGIDVFSSTPITGHRSEYLQIMPEDWFVTGDEQTDSMMIFMFADKDKVDIALAMVREFNEENEPDFPVRAYVMEVEQSI